MKMARFSLLLLLAASSFLHASEGMSFQELFRQVMEETVIDNLIIKYKWGPSICKKIECNIPLLAKKKWTINYFKGYKNNEINEIKHCTAENYNIDEINDETRIEMIKDWISYKRDKPNNKYWKQNYEKYGTCINEIQKFNTVNKYFKNTIELYNKYNIKEILTNYENIHPSNTKTYKLNKIKTAIMNTINVEPAFNCIEYENKQYISEISICYTKKLIEKSCNDYHDQINLCNPIKKIYYPPFRRF